MRGALQIMVSEVLFTSQQKTAQAKKILGLKKSILVKIDSLILVNPDLEEIFI